MKKLITIICCLLLLTSFSFAACDKAPKPSQEVKSTPTSYVTMDINPSIELVVDQNNKVISVYASNEDAEVMLHAEEGIINADISTATDKILDLAVEYGYLSEDNNGVEVSVVADSESVENALKGKVTGKIESKSAALQFDLNVSLEDSFAIQRKLKEYKDKYPQLTGAKLKLMLSAMACDPTLSFDDAYKMDTEELLSVVQTKRDAVNEYCSAAYKKAVEEYELAYEKILKIATKSAALMEIGKIYSEKILTNPLKYKDSLLKAQEMMNNYGTLLVAKYSLKAIILTQETIGSFSVEATVAGAVANALGIDVELLKDEDGKYTIASIEAYISKLAKNAYGEEKANIQAKYDEIITILNEAEKTARESENVIKADVLQLVKDTINEVGTAFEEYDVALPNLEELTFDQVKALSEEISIKADEAYDSLTSILTEEEMKRVEDAEKKAEEKLAKDKQAMEAKIAKAQEDMKTRIEAKKAERKQMKEKKEV